MNIKTKVTGLLKPKLKIKVNNLAILVLKLETKYTHCNEHYTCKNTEIILYKTCQKVKGI